MFQRVAFILCLAACGGSTQTSVVAPQGAGAAPSGGQAPAVPAQSNEQAPPPGRPTTLPGSSLAQGLRPRTPGSGLIHFGGGDGSSMEKAIVILGAQGERDGVAAEYSYIEQLYGPRGAAWQTNSQSLLEKNGHSYDELEVDHGGKTESFYFDITDYFGKM